MKFSNPFRFWPERLYSLPTLRGMIPLGITVYAGFLSVTKTSASHQWLVVMMSLFTVIHLIESSKALRELVLTPNPECTLFAGQDAEIRLISNEAAEPFAQTLRARFDQPGLHRFPRMRVDQVSPSGLFRYWRHFQFKEPAFVLPRPVDHGVLFPCLLPDAILDPDELHEIRDPRLLSLRDEKIFQKTGKSLLRKRSEVRERRVFWLRVDLLAHLPLRDAYEQISFFILELECLRDSEFPEIKVHLPFYSNESIRTKKDLRALKESLARVSGGLHAT